MIIDVSSTGFQVICDERSENKKFDLIMDNWFLEQFPCLKEFGDTCFIIDYDMGCDVGSNFDIVITRGADPHRAIFMEYCPGGSNRLVPLACDAPLIIVSSRTLEKPIFDNYVGDEEPYLEDNTEYDAACTVTGYFIDVQLTATRKELCYYSRNYGNSKPDKFHLNLNFQPHFEKLVKIIVSTSAKT